MTPNMKNPPDKLILFRNKKIQYISLKKSAILDTIDLASDCIYCCLSYGNHVIYQTDFSVGCLKINKPNESHSLRTIYNKLLIESSHHVNSSSVDIKYFPNIEDGIEFINMYSLGQEGELTRYYFCYENKNNHVNTHVSDYIFIPAKFNLQRYLKKNSGDLIKNKINVKYPIFDKIEVAGGYVFIHILRIGIFVFYENELLSSSSYADPLLFLPDDPDESIKFQIIKNSTEENSISLLIHSISLLQDKKGYIKVLKIPKTLDGKIKSSNLIYFDFANPRGYLNGGKYLLVNLINNKKSIPLIKFDEKQLKLKPVNLKINYLNREYSNNGKKIHFQVTGSNASGFSCNSVDINSGQIIFDDFGIYFLEEKKDGVVLINQIFEIFCSLRNFLNYDHIKNLVVVPD